MGVALSPLRRFGVAVVVCALVAGMPSAAWAIEVTSDEFRRLAEAAPTQASALERLRSVDRIDGRVVDVRSALAGADADEVRRRLAVLAGHVFTAASGDPASSALRAEAADILDDPRFRGAELPRPFRGILRWLGERLRDVIDPIARRIPGGESTLWVILGLVVIGMAALIASRVAARRSRSAAEVFRRRRRGGREDPVELEREADAAEQAGDLEEAIRLRFRAGLLRLDDAGVLPYRASLTTGDVHRALRLRSFVPVGLSHDGIVYGRRPARPADVRTARDGWPQVISEASAKSTGSTFEVRTP